jgi:hypothetical protein
MLLPVQISMYALSMRRTVMVTVLSLVACGSYGSTNGGGGPDAGVDVAPTPQDAGILDAAPFVVDAAKEDAADSASPMGVCIPTIGAFCEDFDDPAGVKLTASTFAGGATTTLLNQDGFTAPRAMRFDFPANATSGAFYSGPGNVLIGASAYAVSFYVRVAQAQPDVQLFSLNLNPGPNSGFLQIATNGSRVIVEAQLASLDGGTAYASTRNLDSQLVGFNVWQRIELVVDHASRTLSLTVPNSPVRSIMLPPNADIPANANPSLIIGTNYAPLTTKAARYDIDSIEMRKVR